MVGFKLTQKFDWNVIMGFFKKTRLLFSGINGRIEANQKYSIISTPTIVINEKKLEGSASFQNIEKKIEKLI